MLRSFRLGNHRSFRDEHELLLMPVYSNERAVLPVAAIYGANASGKSNLLDGLRFMAGAVRESFANWSVDSGVPRSSFKLDPGCAQKSSVFVAELVANGVRYTYGFEVDDERVQEEWLYSYPEKRKRMLFEREGTEVRFGTTVPDAKGKLGVLGEFLRPNALFLSLAAQSSIEIVLPVYRWFTQRLTFRGEAQPFFDQVTLLGFLRANETLTDRLLELLRVADLGITGIEYEDSEPQLPLDGLPGHTTLSEVRRLQHRARRRGDLVRLAHGPLSAPFALAEESAGTRSWLMLLPVVLASLRDGGTVVIDEIDASLHPRLTAALVGLFRNPEANIGSAQLVFTTHDASLLSPVLGDEVLTREDVWFVDKNEEGASELYPLTDFKPRKDGENLERRYLGGSYGAVPDVLAEAFVSAVLRGADGQA